MNDQSNEIPNGEGFKPEWGVFTCNFFAAIGEGDEAYCSRYISCIKINIIFK